MILLVILLITLLTGIKKQPVLLHKAMFYEKLKSNYVRCDLCPNNCVLKEDEVGTCGVRQNIGGELYTLVYNQPVAIHVDPIEKKPLYHFYPGSQILSIATVGCNLRCNFCQNWTISQSRPNETTAYQATPEQIIALAKEYDCQSIAFTYTEPTIFYEYMLDIAKLAKKEGLKTVMVTCGYINEKPLRELAKYIDAANIDLKGFSDEFYSTYTTGSLQPVLNTIQIAKEEEMFFEITNLVIPQANDDPIMIRAMCKWIKENIGDEYPLHFSRFFPNYKLTNRPPTPVKTLEMAYEIAVEEGLKYVYIGNVGNIGEDTYCPKCGKLLIDRSGYSLEKINIKNGKCEFCGEEIFGEF
jgi:pyruvate formate lyase activating enzyme